MEPWAAALLGTVGGGLEEYHGILKENRQFNMDQMKADAQYNRQVNLERAKTMMQDAGIDPTTGLMVTREQAQAMPQDQRAALRGPEEVQMAKEQRTFEYSSKLQEQQAQAAMARQQAANAQSAANAQLSARTQLERARIDDERAAKRQIEAESRAVKRNELAQDKLEMKSMENIEKNLTTQLSKVGKAYNDGELTPITGNKAQDLEAYRMVTAVNGLNELEMVNKEKAQKLITQSPSLKKASELSASLQFAMQQSNPVTFITNSKSMTTAEKRDLLNFGVAAGYLNYESRYSKSRPLEDYYSF